MVTKRERQRLAKDMKSESVKPGPSAPASTDSASAKSIDELQADAFVTQARPISEYPDLADVLPDMCIEYRDIQQQIVALEARKKALSADILPLMEAFNANSITDGDAWTVVRSRGTNSQIKKTLLVEQGVTTDIIEAATVRTPYWYVQVRDPHQTTKRKEQ